MSSTSVLRAGAPKNTSTHRRPIGQACAAVLWTWLLTQVTGHDFPTGRHPGITRDGGSLKQVVPADGTEDLNHRQFSSVESDRSPSTIRRRTWQTSATNGNTNFSIIRASKDAIKWRGLLPHLDVNGHLVEGASLQGSIMLGDAYIEIPSVPNILKGVSSSEAKFVDGINLMEVPPAPRPLPLFSIGQYTEFVAAEEGGSQLCIEGGRYREGRLVRVEANGDRGVIAAISFADNVSPRPPKRAGLFTRIKHYLSRKLKFGSGTKSEALSHEEIHEEILAQFPLLVDARTKLQNPNGEMLLEKLHGAPAIIACIESGSEPVLLHVSTVPQLAVFKRGSWRTQVKLSDVRLYADPGDVEDSSSKIFILQCVMHISPKYPRDLADKINYQNEGKSKEHSEHAQQKTIQQNHTAKVEASTNSTKEAAKSESAYKSRGHTQSEQHSVMEATERFALPRESSSGFITNRQGRTAVNNFNSIGRESDYMRLDRNPEKRYRTKSMAWTGLDIVDPGWNSVTSTKNTDSDEYDSTPLYFEISTQATSATHALYLAAILEGDTCTLERIEGTNTLELRCDRIRTLKYEYWAKKNMMLRFRNFLFAKHSAASVVTLLLASIFQVMWVSLHSTLRENVRGIHHLGSILERYNGRYGNLLPYATPYSLSQALNNPSESVRIMGSLHSLAVMGGVSMLVLGLFHLLMAITYIRGDLHTHLELTKAASGIREEIKRQMAVTEFSSKNNWMLVCIDGEKP